MAKMPTEPLPHFSSSVEPKYVKLAYQFLVNHFLTFLLLPVIITILLEAAQLGPDELLVLLHHHLHQILCASFSIVCAAFACFLRRTRAVYLVDYTCFKPPHTCRFPLTTLAEHIRLIPFFDNDSVEFPTRILERSGLGNETSLPPASRCIPPEPSLEASRDEARLVIFSAIDDLLHKTGVRPSDVDAIVVNCSLFSPTPSLTSMIVKQYKLRSKVRTINLSGMGCSASLIAVDFARNLLQQHSISYALVVSTEIITPNSYTGNQRSMLLPNCLLRMGAAAVIVSNHRHERHRDKYRLLHVVRTHLAADDRAYRCVYQEEDGEGNVGVSCSKDLMAVVGEALKTNFTAVGRLVLPASEQLLFLLNVMGRKVVNPKWRYYIPDFKQGIEHFCVHSGVRTVIDEFQKRLKLSAEHLEASHMTLHRFGNTSSSSIWYELSYLECKGQMRRGNRVWMVGFGSGFECNTAIWKCLKTVKAPVEGAWAECINKYPVDVPDVLKL